MLDRIFQHHLFLKHRTEWIALVMLIAIFAYMVVRRHY